MYYSSVFRELGKYLLYLTGILFLPLAVSVYYDFFDNPLVSEFKYSASFAFLCTIAICLLCGLILFHCSGRRVPTLYKKESLLLIAFIWFLTGIIGSLPFLFTRTLTNPLDAYFESISGLTTTGITVLHPKAYDSAGLEIPMTISDPADPTISYTFYGTVEPIVDSHGRIVKEGIEAIGYPLLFWRCFLQWFGGIGIVVIFISIFPALAMGGKLLYESETAGPTKEELTPRIKETTRLLWKTYLGLTILEVILLMSTNTKLSLFEAITLSFSTISTGGFTIYNNGIENFHHPATLAIISLFMILGATKFSLYFYCLKGKFARLRDPEFFYYLLILVIGSIFMSAVLLEGYSFKDAFSYGSFTAISAQTSTGFFVASYDFWPFACLALMMILMYIGGMSSSTAGGIKIIRYVIIFRILLQKIESFFRPGVVRVLKVGDKEVSEKTGMMVLTFFCIIVFLAVLGTFFLILDQFDLLTSFGIISTSLTNTGLVFGGIGSTGSVAFLTPFSKIISLLWMILGRLEFFSLLVLLVPSFWRKT
jgi:trk system potassium uptake protein TrkH